MAAQNKSPATYRDLEDLPPGIKGENIEGTLYTQPRPSPRHKRVGSLIYRRLFDTYDCGAGGPGRWWLLLEPGIEQPGSPEFSPDVAGWRKERLPELPAKFTTIPDWICEVLSPSNRQYDLSVKRPFYARSGLPFLWFIDVDARTLMVHRLVDGKWLELGVWAEDALVRAPPFEEVELSLGELWTK
ncbi:MAG: Uma2 family endonuclease [Myxococcota bacterium]